MNREEYEEHDYLAWNAFVDLIATEDYGNLTEIQRQAHLIFEYSSEVENGGHLQYFVNRGVERIAPTLEALSNLEMDCHRRVFTGASDFVKLNPIDEIESVDDFVAEAVEDNFGIFDSNFYACDPVPAVYLERYLERHFSEFVELTSEPTEKLSIDPETTLPL